MRRTIAAVLVALLAVLGYGTLDVLDLAPGVLTREAEPTAAPVPSTPSASPTVSLPTPASPSGVLRPADAASTAPVPAAAGLSAALAPRLADPWLGPSVGAVVSDAVTGDVLYRKDADAPHTPASTAKILAAAAVSHSDFSAGRLRTRVVAGDTPDEIVLVAGGDTMLSPGTGKPREVEGRAGLQDLADDVAASLGPTRSVTLRLDLTYAAGPRYAPGWNPADVSAGYTAGVAMLGLAGQRPRPFHPSPTDPEATVARAFVTALGKAGVTATLAPASTWQQAAPAGARELGAVESAPVTDVLALALDDSENALTEGLVRQAAVADGKGADFAAGAAYVRETLTGLGVDLSGAALTDTSGLTQGQRLPARVLDDVLRLGTSGKVPRLRAALAQLPVAGVDGSLHDRYVTGPQHSAAGIARAKTGTLTGVSGLAGTLVDADGRLLAFSVIADQVPTSTGTLGARATLDRFVATLASCGCQ
ncbi:MAG: D-alanyl-D-alanine carboxypeptidase [Micrococcales bacterium]|nr:D-alanyl-D-alanine carboxypeptidase [Micrococcales bacterium]